MMMAIGPPKLTALRVIVLGELVAFRGRLASDEHQPVTLLGLLADRRFGGAPDSSTRTVMSTLCLGGSGSPGGSDASPPDSAASVRTVAVRSACSSVPGSACAVA